MNRWAWRWYASYYRHARGRLAASVALSIGQSLLVLPMAYLVKFALDRAVGAHAVRLLLISGAGILALHIGNTLAALATKHLSLTTTKRAIAALRLDLIDRMYAFSAGFYGRSELSGLHSTIVQDTERLDMMSNALLSQFLPAMAVGAGLVAWLAVLNWRLLAAALSVVPLIILINRVLGPRVRANVARYRETFERFSQSVLRLVQTIYLMRVQTAEQFERERHADVIERLRVTSARMSWLSAAYGLLQNSMTTMSAVVILVIGGIAVARGTMSVGDLASFYVGMALLSGQAGAVWLAIPQILAGDESLGALYLLAKTEAPPPYTGTRSLAFSGAITVDAVNFGYDGKPVLSNVSLVIEPSRVTALVGPNGAGKTTLVNLILGFYRPTGGRLLADGCPFDDLDILQLRRSVAVVTQDPLLISDTIRENIALGSPDATSGAVIEASEAANAHRFVRDLPLGYDTPIGDNGMLLSGGQRQRLAIARALLRRPALLILDEPTNHLDAESVCHLLATLKDLPQRPAIFVITHDPAVAREADSLCVLNERGQLQASGELATP